MILGFPLGTPQYIAGVLLLLFAAQGLWLMSRRPLSAMELAYVRAGQMQLHGQGAVTAGSAPLISVLAAAPVAADYTADSPAGSEPPLLIDYPPSWHFLVRLPFLILGVLLGSSLWYVARRLYGNTGGYIALVLYAFSPLMIARAASVQPTILGAWSAFGAVFTAIAVAHTLYAPREVVLWNWRRILLMGLSFGLAAGARFSLLALVPIALLFLLYLAPERRRAALAIFVASCVVGAAVLWGSYGFRLAPLLRDAGRFGVSDFAPGLFLRPLTWLLMAEFFLSMPAVLVLVLGALAAYALWKRARFFGNTAPLLIFLLLLALGICFPHQAGSSFFLFSLPFGFVFVAGVFTDLLESRYAGLAGGLVSGILLAHVLVSLMGLFRVR